MGLLVCVAFLVIFCFLLWWQSLRMGDVQRIVNETKTSSISELSKSSSGCFEVKGIVRQTKGDLRSPVSGKPCAYYRFVVEERRARRRRHPDSRDRRSIISWSWDEGFFFNSGRRRDYRDHRDNYYWRTLIDDQRAGEFTVDDGTGLVEVDAANADLHVRTDNRGQVSLFSDLPASVRSTIEEDYGVSTTYTMFYFYGPEVSRTLRYREELIDVGEEVYVLGNLCQGDNKPRLSWSYFGSPFIVSDYPESEVANIYYWSSWKWWCASIAIPVMIALSALDGVREGVKHLFTR